MSDPSLSSFHNVHWRPNAVSSLNLRHCLPETRMYAARFGRWLQSADRNIHCWLCQYATGNTPSRGHWSYGTSSEVRQKRFNTQETKITLLQPSAYLASYIYVVHLMDIVAVCLIDNFFFCRNVICTVCQSYVYFIALSARLSVTHTICLYFYFLVSRPGMGGR